MMVQKPVVVFCAILATVLLASGENLELIDGFEYIGAADSKIFIQPRLLDHVQWGVHWQQALELCVSYGYRMATIASQAQNDAVKTWMTQDDPRMRRWAWIDGTNFLQSDNWFSIHTGKNLTYFDWANRTVAPPFDDEIRCLRWADTSEGIGMFEGSCKFDWYNVICETPAI